MKRVNHVTHYDDVGNVSTRAITVVDDGVSVLFGGDE